MKLFSRTHLQRNGQVWNNAILLLIYTSVLLILISSPVLGLVNTVSSNTTLVSAANTANIEPWTATSPMVQARCRFSSVFANGFLYAIGGQPNIQYDQLSSVEFAIINSGGNLTPWATTTPLPEARTSMGAFTKHDSVYVVGGWDGISSMDSVLQAPVNPDGHLGNWVSVEPLALPMSDLAVLEVGGNVYAVAGRTVQRTQVLDGGELAPWTFESAKLEVSRNFPALAVIGKYLYVLGGATGNPFYAVSSVERAMINSDGSLGPFSEFNSMQVARHGMAAVVVGNYIYALGGSDLINQPHTSVERAIILDNGDIGSWQIIGSLVNRRRALGAVIGLNQIYALGGTPAVGCISSVERAQIRFFDLPYDYPNRGSGDDAAEDSFITSYRSRNTGVIDHQMPLDYADNNMLSYLGYPFFEDKSPNWRPGNGERLDCGPPNHECYDGHEGYDFRRDKGVGELAFPVAAGTVTDVLSNNGCYGTSVEIDHGNGFTTFYAHLEPNSIPVTKGQAVTIYDHLGEIGISGGCVTGPHIHLNVEYLGKYFDPSGWQDNSPDPLATHPNGTVSINVWKYPVPMKEKWIIDGSLGDSRTSNDGGVTTELQPNTLAGLWEFTLIPAPVAEPSAQLKPIGHSFILQATPIQQSNNHIESSLPIPYPHLDSPLLITLTAPITITINYRDDDLNGLSEDSLLLYLWDETLESWDALNTEVDLVNNVAVASSSNLGLFALLAEDNDIEGPIIGLPTFDPVVASDQALTITVNISDSNSGNHGVQSATLYYSFTVPYTQSIVLNEKPSNTGDGYWLFNIPPQGIERIGQTLKFSIQAIDGDASPATSANNNEGNYFSVEILPPTTFRFFNYLPVILDNS